MIPLVKPIFGKKEKQILNKIIDSRMLASGEHVKNFEIACAKKWGTKYAVAVSSGTTALHAALIACGIKKGDKVLTTPFTFIATSNSVLYCQAMPVFADIDPDTYNISPEKCEEILKKDRRIKAIIPVHLYGTPCNMDDLMYLKKKYNLIMIEDCAQAQGSMFKGKVTGSFGDASAYSFYATKNMSTGEGGAVLTNNPEVDKKTRQIINHGRDGHSTFTSLGYNYRLTNLAAGIGLVQIENIDKWNKTRLSNAQFLNSKLKNISFLKTPVIEKNTVPVFHQYTVRVHGNLRDKFAKHLTDNGIGCGVYYPEANYNQPLYKSLKIQGNCPQAEKAAKEVLSLPVHPALSKSDLQKIVEVISRFKYE